MSVLVNLLVAHDDAAVVEFVKPIELPKSNENTSLVEATQMQAQALQVELVKRLYGRWLEVSSLREKARIFAASKADFSPQPSLPASSMGSLALAAKYTCKFGLLCVAPSLSEVLETYTRLSEEVQTVAEAAKAEQGPSQGQDVISHSKLKVCRDWQMRGYCIYGHRCTFVHSSKNSVSISHSAPHTEAQNLHHTMAAKQNADGVGKSVCNKVHFEIVDPVTGEACALNKEANTQQYDFTSVRVLWVDDWLSLCEAKRNLASVLDLGADETGAVKQASRTCIGLDVEWRPDSNMGGRSGPKWRKNSFKRFQQHQQQQQQQQQSDSTNSTRSTYFASATPNPCSILQVAIEKVVCVFDLIALAEQPQHLEQQQQQQQEEFDSLLCQLFTSKTCLKLGFGFHQDMKRLHSSYPQLQCFRVKPLTCQPDTASLKPSATCSTRTEIDLAPFLDLQHRSRQVQAQAVPVQSISLARLAAEAAGLLLDKTEQCSDWQARPLRRAQLEYAAMDAWCLIQIYNQQHAPQSSAK